MLYCCADGVVLTDVQGVSCTANAFRIPRNLWYVGLREQKQKDRQNQSAKSAKFGRRLWGGGLQLLAYSTRATGMGSPTGGLAAGAVAITCQLTINCHLKGILVPQM